jgi:DNA-binding transcriptional LysR family regulator
MLVRHRIERPLPFMETGSVAVIKETLKREPLAVALLPDDLARELERDGIARILPIDLDFALPAVSFIRRREPGIDPALEVFEETLREILARRLSERATA